MSQKTAGRALLAEDEPPPFHIENQGATHSRFLLTADHAGRLIPRALKNLGVAPPDLDRHIAWDIGIAPLTSHLARLLRAEAIFQTYSRLVIDCNRQPTVPSAFPVVSEATPIPGNENLTESDKQARENAIFRPYHNAISSRIAARRDKTPIYVAMHSFTPVYLGIPRPIEVAVLYNRAPRLSLALAALLRAEGGLVVGENDPYRVTDETDYGVPVHAEAAGLDYVELEIRQDLIAHQAGQLEWAERLARLLPQALTRMEAQT